jgi:L-alanine-DL-glutamate epimerase-like enolase superfamily enzyme
MLEDHIIEKENSYKIRTRYPRLVGKNSQFEEHGYGRELFVREIITDKGAKGWGLTNLMPHEHKSIIGKKLSDLFDPEQGILDDSLKELDYALHDLAGVILGKPVYEMVGGKGKPSVPCYDAGIYFDDISPTPQSGSVEAIVENCRHDTQYGYTDFKLKVGRGYKWMDSEEGLARDIEVTRAVREEFPDAKILVDANDAYDCDGFLQYFDGVADCSLYWIEEPFKENYDDLCRLKEALEKKSPDTLIADGESRPDVDAVLKLAEQKLIDVLLFDIQGMGFSWWRQIMPRVEETPALISPHCWDLQLKTCYAAQIVAGLGRPSIIEGVFGDTEGIDMTGYSLTDGLLNLPDKPGFGMDLVWGRYYDEDGIDNSGYKLKTF